MASEKSGAILINLVDLEMYQGSPNTINENVSISIWEWFLSYNQSSKHLYQGSLGTLARSFAFFAMELVRSWCQTR